MSFPFRYYGHRPADWFEGANDGHIFDVQFVEPPTEVERAELASAFETMLARGPARPGGPWVFSTRFARFAVGERWIGAGLMAFAKVVDFLRRADSICPITDAVFVGMRERGNSRWEAWSLAARAQPDPGPFVHSGLPGIERAFEPGHPEPAPDEHFEAARAGARRQVASRQAAAESADGPITLTAVDAPPEPGPWSDDVLAAFDVPQPRTYERLSPNGSPLQTRSDGDHPILAVTVRPIAHVVADNRIVSLAYLRDDERVQVAFPAAVQLRPGIAVRRDGMRGIATDGDSVYDIDFESGTAAARWMREHDEKSIGAMAFAGDHWLVKTAVGLRLIDPDLPRPKAIASLRAKAPMLALLCNETVVALGLFEKAALVGVAAGKLKRLHRFGFKFSAFAETNGRVVARNGDNYFEIGGIEELYHAWATPLLEKEAARQARGRKKRKAATRISAVRLDAESVPEAEPPLVVPATEVEKQFGLSGYAVKSANGTTACGLDDPKNPSWDTERRRFLKMAAASGEPTDLSDALHHHSRFIRRGPYIDRDGLSIFVIGASRNLIRFDTTSARAEEVHPDAHFVAVLGPTQVAVVGEKSLDWLDGEGGSWRVRGSAKVTGPLGVAATSDGLVGVISKNKAKVQLFGFDGGAVIKLGTLEERVVRLLPRGPRLFAMTNDQTFLELVGAREVRERKRKKGQAEL